MKHSRLRASQLARRIENGALKPLMGRLYGEGTSHEFHKSRYTALLNRHIRLFGDSEDIRVYSVPGRTELAGNHTDHNHGRVLAGSVQLDTIAAAVPTDESRALLDSEGFDPVEVDLRQLEPVREERGGSAALLRGIAGGLAERSVQVRGFLANSTTMVTGGSGLSSSAAVEILIGTIFRDVSGADSLSLIDLAVCGRDAENRYFGKPSGLMDQCACALGGISSIDFLDPDKPAIEQIDKDFHSMGYTLCVVHTGGSHADLTEDYAAIPREMRQAAALFGREVLRGITLEELLSRAGEIRAALGDRALLRAFHFITEDERARQMAADLKAGDTAGYLSRVRESARSSAVYLQNLHPEGRPKEQGILLSSAVTEAFLQGEGACRVHGGGFAGTMQAFIPTQRFEAYREYTERIFGKGSVTPLRIRSMPAARIF